MDDVAWLGAVEVAERVRRGELEAGEVVRCHLERIHRLNPRLGAYVHVDGGAIAGEGPLRGATLAVKDSQPVAGMPWTYGSPRWRRRVAAEDAIPVRRARVAGLAVLGKTNTPELAASVGTVNELFGATRNPWREGTTPGGSSGGSAAAVAAGLCALAFGDDMGGSIRIPASCCGVLGLRPSPRRVPDESPDPTGLSVRGPLARSVADLRVAFATMSAATPAGDLPTEFRVGVVESSPVPVDPACAAPRDRAAAALDAAGCQVVAVAGWDPEPVAAAYQVVRPASVSTMPGGPAEYGAAAGRLIEHGRATPVAGYLAALASGVAAVQGLRDLLQDVHALLTPTLGLLPMPIDRVPPFLEEAWMSYTQFVLPVSFAGLPAVTVPAGLHQGLPVGVQLVGRDGQEWALLAIAERLEAAQGFGFQRPPGW
jgi:amidase